MIACHKNTIFIWKVYLYRKKCFSTFPLLKFSFSILCPRLLPFHISYFLLCHAIFSPRCLWPDAPSVPLYILSFLIYLHYFHLFKISLTIPLPTNFVFLHSLLSSIYQINLFHISLTGIWPLTIHGLDIISGAKNNWEFLGKILHIFAFVGTVCFLPFLPTFSLLTANSQFFSCFTDSFLGPS